MDLDQLQRLFTWGAVLCFVIAAVIILGEVLHWWNDLGELVLSFVTIIGGLLAVVAAVLSATKGQVRAVATGVEANGDKLDVIHDDLGGLRVEQRADLSEVKELLVEIRDRL